MKSVVEKLRADIDRLDERVKAKEAILRSVFSSFGCDSDDRQMIRKVLSVVPKFAGNSSRNITLEQSWCVGFEDSICASFTARNTSEKHNMELFCHMLESGSGIVRCVVLDEHGSTVPSIRAGSSADVLVGFSKSTLFSKSSCALLLEFVQQPSLIKTSDGNVVSISLLSQPNTSPAEVHTLDITAPRTWYSFNDFISAKEHDMLLLLRCLKASCYCSSIKPISSFEFSEANPEFDCCDFGEWQVFVGHKLMNGIVALSSSFDQPDANIDRIYGMNPELVEKFVRKCNK